MSERSQLFSSAVPKMPLMNPNGNAQPNLVPIPGAPKPAFRVLVVDDDPMIRSLLCAIFKRVGYETEIAKDGISALEKATQSHFDLIMSDLRMPGMWGTELYQRLKEVRPELAQRMVFASSESLSADLKQFFQSSGRPYLRKPFSNDEVRKLAAEVCAS
ncbi:MAG TPA: response regulator [Blastocatellia bacterium]|nr:response regulator [Blastocatellia bacterium]